MRRRPSNARYVAVVSGARGKTMGLKERLVKALFGNVIQEEIGKSSRQIVSHITGLGSTEGVLPDINFEIFNQMYEQTSWVRAVVGVICKAVTARGFTLVPLKTDADPKNAETLAEFFANCNPNDTFLEILDDITRDDYVFGNAFLEVVYGPDGKPRELWNLDATSMRVLADDHGTILGYVQTPRFTAGKADKATFEPREVIHFKLGTKGATLYGLSPLASLILPVTVDKFAQVYNRSFFINGAKIRGAFIMKDATPEQVERNREYLQSRAKNPDGAHSDLVLEGQIEFKQIGVNQKDMEFLELREFTRNEILAVYGVPPSKVSIIETGNIGAGTGEHQDKTFYEETVLPFQMRVAEKITKHIIRRGFGIMDWAFRFNRRSIDEKQQAEIFNIYLQNGVFQAEEVRRLVAPRVQEAAEPISRRGDSEVQKGRLGPSETIVNATRAVVAIENRFAVALGGVFRRMKAAVEAKLPDFRRAAVVPKLAMLRLPLEVYQVPFHDVLFHRVRDQEAMKQLNELEVLLELVDQEGISQVVERFTFEAARKGSDLAARRANVDAPDDLSRQIQELLRNNALDLARHIAESLKASLRQSLIEGLAANETISQLSRRIAEQLDDIATVNVRPVTDAQGNVLRAGHARGLSRSSAAEIIARTEANRAFNEGNLDSLRQAEVNEVVFLLANDACEECRAVSESLPGQKLGKTFSINQASGVIPVHPNCRCTWITEVSQ